MFDRLSEFLPEIISFIPIIAAGSAFAFLYFYLFRNFSKAKYFADLVWIVLGGLGAATAVLLTEYTEAEGSLRRSNLQVIERASTVGRDIASFIGSYCSNAPSEMPNLLYNSDLVTSQCASLSINLRNLLSNDELKNLSLVEPSKASYVVADQDARDLYERMNGLISINDCVVISDFMKEISDEEILGPMLLWNFSEGNPFTSNTREYLANESALDGLGNILFLRSLALSELESSRPFLDVRNIALFAFFFVFPLRVGKSVADLVGF